ncbi:hypothetical protein M7775_15450 [Sporomusa sphaeroides DSM 2875]|uniref:hypothetical protein n=1 Tax=Sporomusa sphaeroides TaxID=47679 RepID=UPI00202F636E|nr:hypothetical protein [Sporomusa sphaeroides]MCM0759953.1 hypothetical protein [Sporomusa sphaeroides DSM 2875]
MKFVQTDYFSKKNVLKFPDHAVAIPVTVDDTGITENAEGKKIVPAGTNVGGVDASVLADESQLVCEKNSDGVAGEDGAAVDAEGVLVNDVDVTYGPASGAMLIHGFVDLGKLPEMPHANAVKAMAGRVVFLA